MASEWISEGEGVVVCEQIVHAKTATALCLTAVKNEDKHEFSKIIEAVKVRVERMLCLAVLEVAVVVKIVVVVF